MSRAPSTPAEWRQLAQALFEQGDLGGAESAFKNSFDGAGPQSPSDYLSLARFEIFMSRYEQADDYCTKALSLAPAHPEILLTSARIALFRGDPPAAETKIKQGLAAAPDHPMILYQALELVRPLPEELLERAAELAENLASPTLRFGVARALDRAGNYERAWQMATEANCLQAANAPHWSKAEAKKKLAVALEVFHELPAENPASALRPIYLTGSPRCGGTLIETLIAAHPEIGSAGERGAVLPWLTEAVQRASAASVEVAADAFTTQRANLATADEKGLRAAGIEETQFTDKTPTNADVAGLLARIHPRARFVDIDRDKRDTAVSIFFHEFPAGYPYSMRVPDISAYLDFRRAAMVAWKAAGLTIHSVKYEDFVATPRAEGARLFQALGLRWSPDYLSPGARKAPARTFSSAAVRAPVNMAKSGAWQRYWKHVEHLGP